MAGLGGIPFGVPLGNIGPKSGADFSPYLEMWRMRQAALQTQAAQNLQQQASQQQQMEADKRLAEQARQFDVSSGQRAKEGNREDYRAAQGLALRKDEQAQSLGLRTRAQDFAEQQAAENARRLEQEMAAKKADEAAQNAKAEARQKRTERYNATASRARSIIAQNAEDLRTSLTVYGEPPTPEEMRDAMLADTDKLQGDDRMAVQAAIEEWYGNEVDKRKREADIANKQESTASLKESRTASAAAREAAQQYKIDSEEFKRGESRLKSLQRMYAVAKVAGDEAEAADVKKQMDELSGKLYG